MPTRALPTILLFVSLLATCPAQATAGLLGHARHAHRCCVDECPRCHCKVTIEEAKEKKTCFEVTCEPICIPRVHFPWEKCCAPKCARVKYVHVVKKETYECKKCHYKFEPVCCEPCGCAADAPVDVPAAGH